MKKNILCSIKLWWAYQIYLGNKKLEIRKTKLQYPASVDLYITKNSYKDLDKIPEKDRKMCKSWINKVPLKFTLNKVDRIECDSEQHKKYCKDSCLSQDDFIEYCNGQDLFAWHISNLKIYDKPKELSEFKFPNKPIYYEDNKKAIYGYSVGCKLTRPPQSWGYVEDLEK
ncbi:MAG: hypothetical protein ACI4PF_03810 [Christensenellales bacterium]